VTAAPALRFERVTVRFGDRLALHDVSFAVAPGTFVALAGPNGSGKTTLLRTALGFVAPDPGAVELLGRTVDALRIVDRARHVAWVPQDESPRDDVRLGDYVLYGRFAFHGALEGETAEDLAIADRALRDVGLADRANDGILRLSGGERQRAVLARALAQTAPVLLLDEPTSHLDIGHQLDLLGRVRALVRDRGVTVLAAIHDLNLAARFADRVVVLSRGRLVADGPPSDVLSTELLAQVWGVVADLRRDARTGFPYLIPQQLLTDPGRPVGAPGRGRVHVVGGGGSAAPYLRALAEEGYRVSTGVLPLLDSDLETAEALGLAAAVEVPFAPLGPAARARNRELLGESAAIVVAPFPIGPFNAPNLDDVLPFAGRVPVFLAGPPGIAARDFTGGAASATYAALRARGAVEVLGTAGLLEALASRPTAAVAAPAPRLAAAPDG